MGMSEKDKLDIIINQIELWSKKYGYPLTEDMQKLINGYTDLDAIFSEYKKALKDLKESFNGYVVDNIVLIPYMYDKCVKVREDRSCMNCGKTIKTGENAFTGYNTHGKRKRVWICAKCLTGHTQGINDFVQSIDDESDIEYIED